MKKDGNDLIIPCEVNGLSISTIINVKAARSSISLSQVFYLLQHHLLDTTDLIGMNNTDLSTDRDFIVNLKKVVIGKFLLTNIKATVTTNIKVPFLLGEPDIKSLGNYYINSTELIFAGGARKKIDYSSYSPAYNNDNVTTSNSIAPINLQISDYKDDPVNSLLVVFKSAVNENFFSKITDEHGNGSLTLPAGDSFDIYMMGPQTLIGPFALNIPALKPGSHYSTPFQVMMVYTPTKSYAVDDCYFDSNKWELSPKYYDMLNSLFLSLYYYPTQTISINGFSDIKELNRAELSLNRAQTIKDYLVTKGIAAERIIVNSSDSATTRVNKEAKAGTLNDRRAVITFIK